MTYTRATSAEWPATPSGVTVAAYSVAGMVERIAPTSDGIEARGNVRAAALELDTAWGPLLIVWAATGQADLTATIDPPDATASAGTGNGDTPIDHDTGGADALRILDSGGAPVDDALITAIVDGAAVAQTRTGSDGRWAAPLMLDPGEYILVVSAAGRIQTLSHPLTVT